VEALAGKRRPRAGERDLEIPRSLAAGIVTGVMALLGAGPGLAGSESDGLDRASGLRTAVHRNEVERAWFSAGEDPVVRASAAWTRGLQLGARNYEAAARALLTTVPGPASRLERASLAVRLAPDLPLARMELAAAHLEGADYASALQELLAGIRAIPRHLEASAWLAGSLLAMSAMALTLGCVAFILWVGLSVFRHASHDLGDLVSRAMPDFARAALLAAALLLPMLLGEGLVGLVVGLFLLGFLYCEAGYRRALALSAALLVIGLYPMARWAGVALTHLDSAPVASAAHSVVRSMHSPADIEVLQRAGDDRLALEALALHERRSGDAVAARQRYERLLQETPLDPVVLANLSNIHFALGDDERAILLGERAERLMPSATLLFNLSQVYARSFRMDEFEGALAEAQAIDAVRVVNLSRAGSPDFVADLDFPLEPIRSRMLQRATGEHFVEPVARFLMPGWLGQGWVHTTSAFAVVAALGLLLGGRWEHSSRCIRCGRRVCRRCDGRAGSHQVCEGCHHLFHRPEASDSNLRMARLSELRARDARLGRLAVGASLLFPGAGGLLARRADLSFLGLLFFTWGAVLLAWRQGVVVDPMAVGVAGPLVFALLGGLAFLGYGVVVAHGLVIRRRL